MATHVITGAGSGIGAQTARMLRDRGDHLVLVARNAERAEHMRAEFPAASFLVADLAIPSTLQSAIDAVSLPAEMRSVIHAAGVVDLAPISEASTESWNTQMTVNVFAPAELTRLLLPRLRAARGDLVFVNSGAGLQAHANWGAYAASKHALKALADALRSEESRAGVRVTSVFPGRTATPMQALVHQQEGRAYDSAAFIDPQTVAHAIVSALDTPQDAHVTDVTIRPAIR